jgi:hypothetical protein
MDAINSHLLGAANRTRRLIPFLETIFVDGAYGDQKPCQSTADGARKIEIVKRSNQAKSF